MFHASVTFILYQFYNVSSLDLSEREMERLNIFNIFSYWATMVLGSTLLYRKNNTSFNRKPFSQNNTVYTDNADVIMGWSTAKNW